MTKTDYIKFHAECCRRMQEITQAKNADYTGSSSSPFANFSETEVYAGVATERGFLVRMGDKLSRIRSFIDKGVLQVKDESVEDTLLDLANYCILLAGYIQSKKRGEVFGTQAVEFLKQARGEASKTPQEAPTDPVVTGITEELKAKPKYPEPLATLKPEPWEEKRIGKPGENPQCNACVYCRGMGCGWCGCPSDPHADCYKCPVESARKT